MRATVRRPMYPKPWQRWAWAGLVAVSAAWLTFLPFAVAWQRRIVGWRTVAVYAALSAITIYISVIDFRQWGEFWREVIRYVSWAYLITGVIHVALLDRPRKKKSEVTAGYGAHFGQETTERR